MENIPMLTENPTTEIRITRMPSFMLDWYLPSQSDYPKKNYFKYTDSTNVYINWKMGGTLRWCISEDGVLDIYQMIFRTIEIWVEFIKQLREWTAINGIHLIRSWDSHMDITPVYEHKLDLVDDYWYAIDKLLKDEIVF